MNCDYLIYTVDVRGTEECYGATVQTLPFYIEGMAFRDTITDLQVLPYPVATHAV